VGLVALAFATLGALWRWSVGNIGVLGEGSASVVRTGQLSAETLGRVIRDRGIRTVLNLRGSNPEEPWYREERSVTLGAGATQVDVAMATDQWMSRVQVAAVVELLDSAERPLLVHCQWGAERTGLVSAFAELLRPGGTLESARDQFSAYYLFVPTADGRVMTGHLERYAAWLKAQGAEHSPDRFRKWVRFDYRPGSPSREDWPYDPYPLVVVSRPGGDPGQVADSSQVETSRR
jgi:protein tyrosine phosphatase (PTP) superfamily phosphohydrolase (DUF442 family)